MQELGKEIPGEKWLFCPTGADLEPCIHEPKAVTEFVKPVEEPVKEIDDDTQLSLFPETKPVKKLSNKESQIIKELNSEDLMSVTPIEAINLLYKWQKKLK